MNESGKIYCKQVYRSLELPKNQKQALYSIISEKVEEFLEESPSASYEEILEAFGSPEELSDTYIETSDMTEIRDTYKVKSRNLRIVKIVCVAVIAIALLCTVIFTVSYYRSIEYQSGVYKEIVVDSINEGAGEKAGGSMSGESYEDMSSGLGEAPSRSLED